MRNAAEEDEDFASLFEEFSGGTTPTALKPGEKVEGTFSLSVQSLDSSLWEESRRESSHARNSSTKKETLCSRRVNPFVQQL